ncbi:MAG: hypothetical protein KBG15_03990 [Kofleriaceae bacterium]|nr:hypothetical protein [Kofleriaceae bacterium]
MKAEVMLELLEQAAEQLSVKVSYDSIQSSVGHGGLCRVKGQFRVIIDKRATTDERITTVATALATFDLSDVVLPAKVREIIRQHEGSGKLRRPAA